MTPDQIIDTAKRLGPWWAAFTSRSGVRFGGSVPIDRTKTDWIKNCLTNLGGEVTSALDLGSYEGYHSQHLAEFPTMKRVVGLEGRQNNVDRARFANELCGSPKVEFHVYDLEKIKLQPPPVDGPFDLMFCAGLLYHMTKPWEVIQWMSELTSRYLFIDTHYADIPLYRAGPWWGNIYPEMATETCGTLSYAFWPTLGDLNMMLLKNHFVPRFQYRYGAGHFFQPRIWMLCEKTTVGRSDAEPVGINPLRPESVEEISSVDDAPNESIFHPLKSTLDLVIASAAKRAEFEAMYEHARKQGEIIRAQAEELKKLSPHRNGA
jgi:SAM-dependent methyltransferase